MELLILLLFMAALISISFLTQPGKQVVANELNLKVNINLSGCEDGCTGSSHQVHNTANDIQIKFRHGSSASERRAGLFFTDGWMSSR